MDWMIFLQMLIELLPVLLPMLLECFSNMPKERQAAVIRYLSTDTATRTVKIVTAAMKQRLAGNTGNLEDSIMQLVEGGR